MTASQYDTKKLRTLGLLSFMQFEIFIDVTNIRKKINKKKKKKKICKFVLTCILLHTSAFALSFCFLFFFFFSFFFFFFLML